MAKKYEYKPVTAFDVHDENAVDREAAKRADEAGVVDASVVDYVEALENYENRPDIETLAERRARENGVKFDDAQFRREGKGSAAVTTSDKVDADAADSKKEAAAKKEEAKGEAKVSKS